VSSVDQPVGEVLLREAHHLDADMIVMGLYGHSRLREVVLGGASRHLLQHARLPLLVSH
jgi:nucleotide-binding universal stress UspA family protein